MRKVDSEKKITRGISPEFAEALAKSPLFKLYQEHKSELFLGIRNDSVNLYYNAASVCKVTFNSRANKLSCTSHGKYVPDAAKNKKSDYVPVPIEKIVSDYCEIKKAIDAIHGDAESSNEKKAQQKLVYLNNFNKESNWFCIDIEYVKQRINNDDKKKYGRFDIVAVSKGKPQHRVALIELKYGIDSLGGPSGILKHAEDYARFKEHKILSTHMKKEIVDIVANLNTLGICPMKIDEESELNDEPEFYFITLNNNPKKKWSSTPKMTMAGYVFCESNEKYTKEGAKRPSSNPVESKFGDITDRKNKELYAQFLFSEQKIDNLSITDIIDDPSYDRTFGS